MKTWHLSTLLAILSVVVSIISGLAGYPDRAAVLGLGLPLWLILAELERRRP